MLEKANASSKLITGFIVCLFLFILLGGDILQIKKTEATVLGLPEPTRIIKVSADYNLPILKGIKLDEENPLNIKFVVDTGNKTSIDPDESQRLVNYFLSALTTPTQDLWVNLSPYEKDRIVPDSLGITELGRDLLGQDYILKQLSASLTHPETPLGKSYWHKLSINDSRFPANSNAFSKIWIVPDVVELNEENGLVLISNASLKLQTEADYLANKKNNNSIKVMDATCPTSVLLSELTREVNSGKNFAKLRQVYNSIVLAIWFKKKFQNSFYQSYLNQNKTKGIEIDDIKVKEKIWNLYCKSFAKGVYKLSKKDSSQAKRSYSSGGVKVSSAVSKMMVNPIIAYENTSFDGNVQILETNLSAASSILQYYEKDGLLPGSQAFVNLGGDKKNVLDVEKVFRALDLPIGFEIELLELSVEEMNKLSRFLPFQGDDDSFSEFSLKASWSLKTQLAIYDYLKENIAQFDDVFMSLQANMGMKRAQYESMSKTLQDEFISSARHLMTAITFAYVSDDRIMHKVSDKVVRLRKNDSHTRGINGKEYYRYEYGFGDKIYQKEIVNAIYYGHYLLRKSIFDSDINSQEQTAIDLLHEIIESTKELIKDINYYAPRGHKMNVNHAKTFKALIPYRDDNIDIKEKFISEIERLVDVTQNQLGFDSKPLVVSSSIKSIYKWFVNWLDMLLRAFAYGDLIDYRNYYDFVAGINNRASTVVDDARTQTMLDLMDKVPFSSRYFYKAANYLAETRNLFLVPGLLKIYKRNEDDNKKKVIGNVIQFIINESMDVKRKKQNIYKITALNRLNKRNEYVKQLVAKLQANGKQHIKIRDFAASNGLTSMQLAQLFPDGDVSVIASDLDDDLVIVRNDKVDAIFDRQGNCIQVRAGNNVYGGRYFAIPDNYQAQIDLLSKQINDSKETIDLVHPQVRDALNDRFMFNKEDIFSPHKDVAESDIVLVSNLLIPLYFNSTEIDKAIASIGANLKDGAILLSYNTKRQSIWIKKNNDMEKLNLESVFESIDEIYRKTSSTIVSRIPARGNYCFDDLDFELQMANTKFRFKNLFNKLNSQESTKRIRWADLGGGVGFVGFSHFALALKEKMNALNLYGVGRFYTNPNMKNIQQNIESGLYDSDYIVDKNNIFRSIYKKDLPEDMNLITSFDLLHKSKNPLADIAYMYNHLAVGGLMVANIKIPKDTKLINFYEKQINLLSNEHGLDIKLSRWDVATENVSELYIEIIKTQKGKLVLNNDLKSNITTHQIQTVYRGGWGRSYKLRAVEYDVDDNVSLFRTNTGGIDLQSLSDEVTSSSLDFAYKLPDIEEYSGFMATIVSIDKVSKDKIIAMAKGGR